MRVQCPSTPILSRLFVLQQSCGSRLHKQTGTFPDRSSWVPLHGTAAIDYLGRSAWNAYRRIFHISYKSVVKPMSAKKRGWDGQVLSAFVYIPWGGFQLATWGSGILLGTWWFNAGGLDHAGGLDLPCITVDSVLHVKPWRSLEVTHPDYRVIGYGLRLRLRRYTTSYSKIE